ncbi:biotin transporter BioY [Stappia indica]|uniref:biotin transporter BioY n=1 Tax=Stappia indica TaxID=538381 RepID=UPI001CD32872|nr:biotin transporter BioY [Stappia indica]MCA1297482.1 biotin transporter BioY [Stappia indica]
MAENTGIGAHPRRLAETAALVVGGSLLLTLSAKVSVPFYPVPMTLQTMALLVLGFTLGPARAGMAVLLYLAQGAAGFPVFSGTPEKGIGLAYMMGPTGGFLLGFLASAMLAGWFAAKGWTRSLWRAVPAAILAEAAVFVPGLLWLGALLGFDKPILAWGLYPFVLGGAVKALLAAAIAVALHRTAPR